MSGPSSETAGDASTTGFQASPRERLASFPWHVGLAGGIAAFLAGYAAIYALFLSGFAGATGTFAERLPRTVGYVLYNAHGVAVVGSAPSGVLPISFDLLDGASNPLVYRSIPPVALLLVTGLLTYRYRPERRDALVTAALALSLTVGYLLAALVGTYVFTESATTQGGQTVVFHPNRLPTLLYGLAYPLGLGILGNLVGQAVLLRDDAAGDGHGAGAGADDFESDAGDREGGREDDSTVAADSGGDGSDGSREATTGSDGE